MASVVVCDDDPVLRRTISDLCEDAGLHVVAETDRGGDAVELVRRFGVDIVVLDLSLSDGSGERSLELLHEETSPPIVVVFTAYASDPGRLIRMGAREVIEKPDVTGLASVLERLARPTADDAGPGTEERRQASRSVEPLPELWRSPSGISTSADLPVTLRHTIEGDAVLVVTVSDLARLEAEIGPTLATDCRLAVGRLLRATLRAQDAVHDSPELQGFVAVLRGGDSRAAEAAWSRLVAEVAASATPGQLTAAHARIDAVGGGDAHARAVAAVRSAGPGGPTLIGA